MNLFRLLGLAVLACPWLLRADAVSPTAKPTLTGKQLEVARQSSPPGHRIKAAAASTQELHTAKGSILSIDTAQKKVSINHAAFADGFQGAGTAAYPLQDQLMAKIGKFQAGDRVEFILRRDNGAESVWAMRKL
jgi:Cu/Ag efflux protein CusF